MTHRQTAHSGCPDGPCPLMTIDHERGKVGIQTYDLPSDADRSPMPPTPAGEHFGEMDIGTFEYMLAQHLDEDAWARIAALRDEV